MPPGGHRSSTVIAEIEVRQTKNKTSSVIEGRLANWDQKKRQNEGGLKIDRQPRKKGKMS